MFGSNKTETTASNAVEEVLSTSQRESAASSLLQSDLGLNQLCLRIIRASVGVPNPSVILVTWFRLDGQLYFVQQARPVSFTARCLFIVLGFCGGFIFHKIHLFFLFKTPVNSYLG